jgi:hypothetical protein
MIGRNLTQLPVALRPGFNRRSHKRGSACQSRQPLTVRGLLISLVLAAIVLTFGAGCNSQKDPELGPTHPAPPPANMQGGKLGSTLQGGMPGSAAPKK